MIRLTSKEQKALLLLVVILAAGALVQFFLPHKIKSRQYDYSLQDSLFKALSVDTLKMIRKKAAQTAVYPEKEKRIKLIPKKKTDKKTLKQHSIDINTAGLKELETLPGVGPKTAQWIIDYRTEHGRFNKPEELTKVKRIGSKTLQKIRPYIFIKSLQKDSILIK